MHTVRIAPGIKEKDEILIDKYSVLLNPYPSEKARAEAVFEQTGADMYLFPRFRSNHVQKDISPRTEFNVELRSWTEETGGPDGYRKYNERKWTEHHVIPEKAVFLHIMELEFDGYDTDANKVLTFHDSRREYNVDERHQFKNISKYIRKDFEDIKSGKRDDKGKTGTATVGFKDIKLPPDVGGNEFSIKGAYFGMKIEAVDRLKNFKVITDANSNEPLNYYVTGNVSTWRMISTWNPPKVTVYASVIDSEEKEWYDSQGKKHKMKIKKYQDKITDHYAYWSFVWQVRATFQLINARTGEVIVTHSNVNNNDKVMDAYRQILKEFYKKVNERFKN